jgi:hypothetical protein
MAVMARESLGGQLVLPLLSALRAEPAHGYAVIEEVRRRSEQAFDLPERMGRAGLEIAQGGHAGCSGAL